MKKFLAIILSVIMIGSVFANVVSAIDGITNYVPDDYEDGPAQDRGWIRPLKDSVIQNGLAGSLQDDTFWLIQGVKGDSIPKIDGKVTDKEGYRDFESYQDYLYIYAATLPEYSYSVEDFNAWYEEVKNMNLIVKSCWDGQYLYFYFEYEIKDYICMPSNPSNMWMYNCIQFGVANTDAIDDERSETGYSIDSRNETLYTASWGQGSFVPAAYTDYRGTLADGETDPLAKKVTHEFRVDIRKALGRSEPVKSGEEIRLAWVLMANTTGNGSAARHIAFADGICSTTGGKQAHRFARVRLIGEVEAQEGIEPDYYTPTEEDWECMYNQSASLFFHDIYETNDFTSNDGITATYSEDKNYVTLTTDAEESTYFSQGRYPAGLWAKDASYAVIKYRTNTEGINVALNFKSTGMLPEVAGGTVDFKEEAWMYPEEGQGIVADGEWNYAIYKLTNDTEVWANIITEMSIKVTKGSIDIDSIRFYNWDPEEIYGFGTTYWGWCDCDECNEECPCLGECTDDCDCLCFEETEDDQQGGNDDTTQGGNDDTTDNTGKDDTTTDTKDDKSDASDEKKDGCKASIACGAAIVLASVTLAGAVVLKKKED